MAEPPEPRYPDEEGGGEEDYATAWENADAAEIMGGLEDDALLDSIRDGIRGDLGPDELTELLSGLRDEPDAIDIPVPNTARVDRGENVLPPRPAEGALQPVSAQEEAARLRQLAGNTSVVGALQEAAAQLESMVGEIQNALGQGHSQLDAATAPIAQAIESVNAAAVTVGSALGSLEGIAGQIG